MSAAFYPQVQKIYVAYYGRPADPAGLQYWAGQLAANGGNLTSIINAFGASAESTALYAGADNSAKITAIYQQLFNRAPDAAGLAFYTAELTANRMTASSIALNVANGAQGTDATYLNNKATVATAFTDALTVDSAATVAYTGTTAETAARSLITGVTTSAATTNVASTIASIKSSSVAGQTFTLTAAMTLALADALPERYNIASGDVDGGNSSVEAYNEGSALAESVIAGATNASTVDLNVTYTITDTLANLVAAESEILENAASYSLTTTAFTANPVNTSVAGRAAAVAAAQAGFFSAAQQAIIAGAANGDDVAVSVAYTLTDTVANLAAASAAVLAGATSYSLSNAAGALGELTQAQIDVVEGASNAASFTYGLQGSTFVLTTDDDEFDLTAGNDTVSGGTATLGADDSISDTSSVDRDVLNLTLTADPVAMDVTNVESINITWDAYSTPDVDLDNVRGATVSVASSKVGYNGNVNFTNVAANSIVAGEGVTGRVDVEGIEGASIVANSARTVDVGGTSAADGAVSISSTSATTVVVNGGDDLTINAQAATTVTITSTGMDTAALTLGKNATLSMNGTNAIVGLSSASNIEVDLAAGVAFEELNITGAGEITVDVVDTSDVTGLVISGAKTIKLSDNAGGAFDAEEFDADKIVYESAQGAGTHVFKSGANIEADLDFGAAITFATSTSEDGDADEITLTTNASQTGLLFNTASRAFETVNLVVDASAATTFTALTAPTTGKVNLTSNQNVTFTAVTAAEIDADTLTKNLTVTASNAGDLTVAAGSGTNSVAFAGTTHNSAYVGGAANDTVTFATTSGDATAVLGNGLNSLTAAALDVGTLVVTGGTGNDTVTTNALTTGSVTANLGDGVNAVNATSAVTGLLSVIGGSGNDTITTGATTGTVSVAAGAGTNSLTADALTSGTLNYTGGTGNDTISATAAVTGTITVTAGDGVNSLDTNLTTGTLVYVGGAGNDTVTADAGTTGSLTINLGDGASNTATATVTTGKLTVVGGTGIDTMTITTVTTGTVSLDGGSGNDVISLDGALAAGATVNVSGGAGNDRFTLLDGTVTGVTVAYNGGDGTDTLTLDGEDLTDGTISLDSVEVIANGSNDTTSVLDGDLLNGKTYSITGDGTTTDRLSVHLDSAGTYDFSGLQISGAIATALAGLAITAQTASVSHVVTGTDGGDSITGASGNDTITGGLGADFYVGAAGNDTYVIGATASTFISGHTAATTTGFVDQITITAAQDTIQLSSAADAYGTGITLDSDTVIVFTNVGTLANTDYATLAAMITGAATAATETASTSDILYVYQVQVVASANTAGDFDSNAAGYYIFINDGTTALTSADTILYMGTTNPSITNANFTIV